MKNRQSTGDSRLTTVACGHRPWRGLARYDTRSSSWKAIPRRAGVISSTVYQATWRQEGMTRGGVAFAPTPTAAHQALTPLRNDQPDVRRLLPTPTAINPNDGEVPQHWVHRRERHRRRRINGNGMVMPLSIAVRLQIALARHGATASQNDVRFELRQLRTLAEIGVSGVHPGPAADRPPAGEPAPAAPGRAA